MGSCFVKRQSPVTRCEDGFEKQMQDQVSVQDEMQSLALNLDKQRGQDSRIPEQERKFDQVLPHVNRTEGSLNINSAQSWDAHISGLSQPEMQRSEERPQCNQVSSANALNADSNSFEHGPSTHAVEQLPSSPAQEHTPCSSLATGSSSSGDILEQQDTSQNPQPCCGEKGENSKCLPGTPTQASSSLPAPACPRPRNPAMLFDMISDAGCEKQQQDSPQELLHIREGSLPLASLSANRNVGQRSIGYKVYSDRADGSSNAVGTGSPRETIARRLLSMATRSPPTPLILKDIAGMWEISETSDNVFQDLANDLQITCDHIVCADGTKYGIEIHDQSAVAAGKTFGICNGLLCCTDATGTASLYQKFSLAPESAVKPLQGQWCLISGGSAFAQHTSLVIKGFSWIARRSLASSCLSDFKTTHGFVKIRKMDTKETLCVGGCFVEVLPDTTMLLVDPFFMTARYGRDIEAAASSFMNRLSGSCGWYDT